MLSDYSENCPLCQKVIYWQADFQAQGPESIEHRKNERYAEHFSSGCSNALETIFAAIDAKMAAATALHNHTFHPPAKTLAEMSGRGKTDGSSPIDHIAK